MIFTIYGTIFKRWKIEPCYYKCNYYKNENKLISMNITIPLSLIRQTKLLMMGPAEPLSTKYDYYHSKTATNNVYIPPLTKRHWQKILCSHRQKLLSWFLNLFFFSFSPSFFSLSSLAFCLFCFNPFRLTYPPPQVYQQRQN